MKYYKNRFWCEVCDQGFIRHYRINPLNIEAYICEECDALWLKKDEIDANTYIPFSTFLEDNGTTLKSDTVTPLDEEEIKKWREEFLKDYKLCSRCGKSYILYINVKKINKNIYICQKCNSVWLNKEDLDQPRFDNLRLFLAKYNLGVAWSEFELLEDKLAQNSKSSDRAS